MHTVIWVLFVVISNANGDPMGVADLADRFESKQECQARAIEMRLFPENFGCRPVFVKGSKESDG